MGGILATWGSDSGSSPAPGNVLKLLFSWVQYGRLPSHHVEYR